MQRELFETERPENREINGLRYIPDFLSEKEESQLVEDIDASAWITELKRRVQHYGYKYDYKSRAIDPSMYVGALPSWSSFLTKRLMECSIFSDSPDQMIVNEYLPGQGIAKHVDCVPCFKDVIVSVTISSGCIMEFTKLKAKEKIERYLERRSAVVLSGESRYDWQHGIPGRKSDVWNEEKIGRSRRLSLTFRRVSI